MEKFKKAGLITGIIILTAYIIFLILPFILSPILNSYKDEIAVLVKESTGYDVKLEKLGVVTGFNLSAGISIGSVEFMIPGGEEFLSAEKFKAKIALLPLLIGKIEADSITVDNLYAYLKIRPDGHLLIEEYLPQPDPDKPAQNMQPMPFKLSNHLPDIIAKSYDITLADTKSEYTISGQDLKLTDFILDKKFKFSTKGFITLNSIKQFTYDIKLYNKIMPEISLNDMVSNSESSNNNTTFPILDIFKAINKSRLSADLTADLTSSGSFESPDVNGKLNIDNISLLVDGKPLPKSFFHMNAKKNNIDLDLNLYTANNEKTLLKGNFKTGKNPKIDMNFVSDTQINNIFRIINSLAKAFNYNDLETLTANGSISSNFNIKSDLKHVKSSGYIKIPSADINYGLYNLALNNITADIDLNNMINIKNAGFEIKEHPLRINGTIKNDSQTDIHVFAEKLPLKGLIAAAGQVQILKDNKINSGTLSLDATATGKLTNITPSVTLSVNDVNIKNKPANTRITLNNADFTVIPEDKKFNGNLALNNLKITNPAAVLNIPDTNVVIGDKNIDIKQAYVLLNNSRIDITGGIKNYLNDKLKIELTANGFLLADDISKMLPEEFQPASKGKLPLNITVTGDKKVQDILFNITATPSNYAAILDIDLLKGKTTVINSNIRIMDDSAKFTDTYISGGNVQIATLEGGINSLSKDQTLNMRFSVPKKVSFAIPGVKNSNISARGDIDITGTIANPYLKGLVSIPSITMPDITITNTVANINGPILKGNGTIQTLQSGGIAAQNLAAEFLLKNYSVIYLNNITGDAFEGKISGNISYGLNDGKIKINMTGSEMNAAKAIEGSAGIKNALSGTLAFKADITTKGATDVDIMKNLKGSAAFDINNGKFLNVGRFDSLLYAQNILANAVLKTAVTSITSLPIIQNTAEFKTIKGDLLFDNSWAKINSITTSGPLMAYYITGRYNLLNGTTNAVILGRLDSKVVSVLGPLGDLSVEKLTSYIPKFGTLTGMLINSMTTDPEKENTANIPSISSDSYKDFKVEFNGGIDGKTSVKSFKWLSKCDTTAIDNPVDTVKQNLSDTKDAIKNSIENSKQQLIDAKENLKNLFKF